MSAVGTVHCAFVDLEGAGWLRSGSFGIQDRAGDDVKSVGRVGKLGNDDGGEERLDSVTRSLTEGRMVFFAFSGDRHRRRCNSSRRPAQAWRTVNCPVFSVLCILQWRANPLATPIISHLHPLALNPQYLSTFPPRPHRLPRNPNQPPSPPRQNPRHCCCR